jgi:hypothetical protein
MSLGVLYGVRRIVARVRLALSALLRLSNPRMAAVAQAVVQAVASVVTAAGIVIAVIGLRQAQRQRLRQFESLYVKRYWDLMDD